MIVIISAAATNDGYMDDSSPSRLVISGDEDWREVYALRAECDAILVGAGTLRKDNPALVIRDEALRRRREAAGKPADIIKVAVSGSGRLDPSLRFFTEGAGRKIVITREDADSEAVEKYSAAGNPACIGAAEKHSPLAEIIRLPVITACGIAERLAGMGIEKLMVEGGAEVLKMFFDEDMADRVRLAVSPLTLAEMCGCQDSGEPAGGTHHGDRNATRLPYFGHLPFEESAVKRTHKAGAMEITDYIIHPKASYRDVSAAPMASLNMTPNSQHSCHPERSRRISCNNTDLQLLQRAIDISKLCTPAMTAYSVGCVIETADGRIFEGYTHESAPHNHAEEEAILKAEAAGAELAGATIYTSMEPCSTRKSKPVSCCELILRHKMVCVVYAFAEPDNFVQCNSTAMLRNAGIEVVIPEGFAEQVVQINAHLINVEI